MSGKDRVRVLAGRLSERDRALLASLREFRLMSGAQLRRLHFPAEPVVTQARKARAALTRLAELRVVVRLNRRAVGGLHAGSDSYVYGLSGWGHAVLDIDSQTPQRHRRVTDAKPAFQAHALAVSGLAVLLRERERAGSCVIEELRAEPGGWRTFGGLGGGRRVLKPDLYVRLGVGAIELSAFIEMDMGTESVSTTIARKCAVYLDYYRSGQEQHLRGVFPLVWWLVPTAARLAAIAQLIQRLPGDARQLFTVALHPDAADLLIHPPTPEGGAR